MVKKTFGWDEEDYNDAIKRILQSKREFNPKQPGIFIYESFVAADSSGIGWIYQNISAKLSQLCLEGCKWKEELHQNIEQLSPSRYNEKTNQKITIRKKYLWAGLYSQSIIQSKRNPIDKSSFYCHFSKISKSKIICIFL